MSALKNSLVLGHTHSLSLTGHRSPSVSVSYTIERYWQYSSLYWTVLAVVYRTGRLYIEPHTVIGVLQKSTVVPTAIDTISTHERKSVSVASLRSRTELPYS